MEFKNPIISGFHPDPSICRNNLNEYFLVTSSFEYFPSIPIFKSVDLVNWDQIGHVLTRPSQLDLTRVRDFPVSQGVYAPTIRFYQGKYYVITTNMTTMQTFYVSADHPESGWSEPVYLEGFMGYDPSLYFEGNEVYLTASALPFPGQEEGVIQATIDLTTGKLASDIQQIWQGTGHSSPEGPHLYKKDGMYYLLIAEGGTEFGHMMTIARSSNPFGPFVANPDNPIVSNRSTSLPIQATGHGDLIETHTGEWVAVLLGIRPFSRHKMHYLGRETMLTPVRWTGEGWPVLGAEGRVQVEHKLIGEAKQVARKSWQDDFSSASLNPRWNSIRHLEPSAWFVSEGLNLVGNPATLNSSTDSPVFIGCRQDTFRCHVSVKLNFLPTNETDEAGLTIYMNEQFHYDLFRMKKDSKQIVGLRKQIGDITHIVTELVIPNEGEITIHVETTQDSYFWWVEDGNRDRYELGNGQAKLLSKEVAGGFTGVFIGMYATGNGKLAETSALFKNFLFERQE